MTSTSTPEQGTAGARVVPTPTTVPENVRDRVTVKEIDSDEYGVEIDGEPVGAVWPSEVESGYWAFTSQGDCTADGETLGGAVRYLVEYVLRERGHAAIEEPEDEGEGLRDHVHVGLPLPIRVYRRRSTYEDSGIEAVAEWWYYVQVQLPGRDGVCVGLVERREREDGGFFWAGLAEPGYGTHCWEDTMQEAIDALVRYTVEVNIEFREGIGEGSVGEYERVI